MQRFNTVEFCVDKIHHISLPVLLPTHPISLLKPSVSATLRSRTVSSVFAFAHPRIFLQLSVLSRKSPGLAELHPAQSLAERLFH